MKKKKEHVDGIIIPLESLEKLEEKAYLADECMKHLMRLKAEFENYKKRHEKILMENRQLSNERLIKEIIPVLENLDRALDKTNLASPESFSEGIMLINSQLNDILKKQGLTRMQTIGFPFNPVLHEALMHVPSEEYPEDVIVEDVHGGYMLFDRVIKHAQVIVSKGRVEEKNINHKSTEFTEKTDNDMV
ncbi:nucleotide exchange factor GrpE [bacterium]|nr:nucleotide exchange factor GrpE [bacterium]MBU1753632.1 nucleotide exchange factor GrpE [bacterium]